MYVRDQLIRARPLVRASARARQAAQAQRRPPVALPRYAPADRLACLVTTREQERRRLGRELHDADGVTRWRPR